MGEIAGELNWRISFGGYKDFDMKINTILLIIVMFIPLSLYAEAGRGQASLGYTDGVSKEVYRNDRITLGIQTSMANGVAHELVYSGSHKLSELIWDIKNVFMLGGSVSAVIYPAWGLKFNADISTSVKKQDSTMDDYDWFLTNTPWTHWSHHENTTLEKALTIDASLSKSIFSNDVGSFNMDVELGFKRENWRWSASGGTFIYSVTTFRDTAGTFVNTPGISYEQTINTPYIGGNISYREDYLSLLLRVVGSPFVFAEAVDHHYWRSLVFTDTFSSGNMLGIDLSIVYHMRKNVNFSINYSYQKYYINRGDAVIVNQTTGAQTANPDNAGMGLAYHRIGIGGSYSF